MAEKHLHSSDPELAGVRSRNSSSDKKNDAYMEGAAVLGGEAEADKYGYVSRG